MQDGSEGLFTRRQIVFETAHFQKMHWQEQKNNKIFHLPETGYKKNQYVLETIGSAVIRRWSTYSRTGVAP